MLKKVYWQDINKAVAKLCPDFAKVINSISPDKSHYLYQISYPYGATILDKGTFQVPNSTNHIVLLNHSSIP